MSFLTLIQKLFAPRQRIIGTTDLRRALNNNEFVFYYQPEWDLKTGVAKGVEALIRWESPNGIIPPDEFIPVLEKTGMINEFTPFLLNQSLHDLKELHALGFSDLFMSVNISTVQLKDAGLLDQIQKMMAKYEITPDSYECELTETGMLKNPSPEFDMLKSIRQNGIKISIDDFGSGHASFNYLKDLDTHKLKIDREFVKDMFSKPSNQVILRTIIDLGHALDLTVLAEGIELPEQEKWLKENGCDYGQGFLFSRPLPLPMLISFLRSRQSKQTSGSDE